MKEKTKMVCKYCSSEELKLVGKDTIEDILKNRKVTFSDYKCSKCGWINFDKKVEAIEEKQPIGA